MDFYEVIDKYLSEGRGGVLGTIIKGVGSIPQGAGAKVFIGEDTRLYGTIGGGCLEAEVTREARWLTGGRETKVIHYALTGTEAAEEGMICGGSADIFLEPVLPTHLDLYQTIRACLKSGKRASIITAIGTGGLRKSLFCEDGRQWGFPLAPLLAEVADGSFGERSPFIREGFLIEPLNPKARLFVYGAGHISQFISKLAGMIDFEVTIIDDRMSYANRERFPESERVLAGFFSDVLHGLDRTPEDYHVIVTRGHKNDAEVLEWVLKGPSAYVGMIGSKRKTKIIYDHLTSRGVDPGLFSGVYSPIGLDIDAETPQEIAMSIVAELVRVRAARRKKKQETR